MGFLFTLLFVVAAYLNPETVFGDLVQYHVQVIVAMITLFCSLPAALGSGTWRMPQTYAAIGLVGSVGVSLLLAGWLGGVLPGVLDFVPNVMVFFFIIWNVNTRRRLQVLIAVLLFCALFLISAGMRAVAANDVRSHYLLAMMNDAGQYFFRICGTSFLNDPNDLAQFMIALIPMLFIFWKKGRVLGNVALVYAPSACLLYGVFLTHSRGAMVALMVTVVVAFRRKIGLVPSLIGGAGLFIGLIALGFSGGRDVSAGEDRVETWSNALSLVKSHPLFGVGFKRFNEFFPVTAHNTILMCAAEIGLIGLFCWMLFVCPTVWNLVRASAPAKLRPDAKDDKTATPEPVLSRSTQPGRPMALAFSAAPGGPVGGITTGVATYARMDSPRPAAPRPFGAWAEDSANSTVALQDEARRVARLLVAALTAFLTAAWFLPRAYTMTVFLYAGIAVAAVRMAREQGITVEPLSIGRAAKVAAIACVAGVAILYIIIRLDHLVPR